MDALQTVTFAGLIIMAVIPYLVWIWHFKDLLNARMQGNRTLIRPMNLKDVILIVFLLPVVLTGGVGALWLYVKGWEDFTRTISICIWGGFIGGALITSVVYIFNLIGLRMANSKRSQE